MVQFDLLPSPFPRATPWTSSAFRAREWKIVCSGLSRGEQIKNIFSLILRSTGQFSRGFTIAFSSFFIFKFISCSYFNYMIMTCTILLSINSRKRLYKMWKLLALLLHGNQYCFQNDVSKITWGRSGARGWGLSLTACPGVRNRPTRKKKIANPLGGMRGGGPWLQEKLNHA